MGCAGCATANLPPAPLAGPEQAAAAYTARSLRDPGLHRFLTENLGHDPGDAWDFESLTWAAFYFHPSLEVARAQWAGARAAQSTPATKQNPTLTLTPGYNFTREAGLSPWMPALNFDFLFSTAGKRGLAEEVARHDAEAARLSVFTTAWQVRTELRHALADAAVASRRTTQLRAQAETQRALLTLLDQRFAAGSVAATEVSTARVALLRAESAASEAQGQTLTARAHVAAALGLPLAAIAGMTLPPAPALTPLAPDALSAARREALQSRPDLLIALAKYHSAHAALQLEAAKQTPDLHLGPGYQWDQGANKWTLSLGLELPFFHHNEAGIAAAVAHRAEAAAQFELAQAQAIAAIDLAAAAQDAAQLQLEHARLLRAETQQQSARMQQRIDLGAADRVELQTSQLELAVAELAVVDAENAAQNAAGQLEDALQLPFPHLTALAASTSSRPQP
jgi:cobalt-zinc-cadmium efflux system outer membrane protein